MADASSGFAGSNWTLFRVRGVPIVVGPSLVALLALFTYFLGTNFVRRDVFALTPGVAWSAAAAGAVVFVACVLAHELGHTLTSLDRGLEVRSITLFLLGGVTESVGQPRTARDEIVIVGIGPLISLVIGAAFGLATRVLPDGSPVEVVVGLLAWLNVGMAIFNLVPGYPLDGGRLLRAVLWMVTGARHRATRWAARVGQLFALSLVVGAVVSVTGVPQVPIPGVQVGLRLLAAFGLWGGLIGIFLLRSAMEEHAAARYRESLESRTVGDAVGELPPTLPAALPLSDAVVPLQQHPAVLYPVGDPLVGGVRLDDLDGVARSDWHRTPVSAVARNDVTVDDDLPMDQALERLARAPGQTLIVTRRGVPVGVLTPSLVARAVS